jgi:hypothetical protein
MAVNEVYKASMIFQAPEADGDMVITSHYRTSSVVTPVSNAAEALEIGNEVASAIVDEYLSLFHSSAFIDTIEVIGISDPLVGITVSVGANGTETADALGYRNCPVVKLTTGLRGRSYQGRMYLIAPSELRQDAGALEAGYISQVNIWLGRMQVLTGTPSGNTYRQTVYSRTLSTPPSVIVDNVVQASIINPNLGTQRGRQKV